MSTAEHDRTVRLFFAIRPAGAAALAGLSKAARPLLQGEARWLAADHLHLTLAFAATFPTSRLDALQQGAQEAVAGIAPFAMRGCGLALWPAPSRARLLVALFEPEPSCSLLAGRLATLLKALGVPVEKRLFRPHITLARLKGRCSLRQQVQPICRWWCEGMELLQSQLDQHGSHYQFLASWPLSASPSG
jgi:2'-5' RNA ligase